MKINAILIADLASVPSKIREIEATLKVAVIIDATGQDSSRVHIGSKVELTETTSNTASSSLLMPILAAAALANDIDPALIMIPAVMSASCAFMLPVATAPNSIVFSTGLFSMRKMALEGLAINIVAALVIATCCYYFLV